MTPCIFLMCALKVLILLNLFPHSSHDFLFETLAFIVLPSRKNWPLPVPYVKSPGPDKIETNLRGTVPEKFAKDILGENNAFAKIPQTTLKYTDFGADKENKGKKA